MALVAFWTQRRRIRSWCRTASLYKSAMNQFGINSLLCPIQRWTTTNSLNRQKHKRLPTSGQRWFSSVGLGRAINRLQIDSELIPEMRLISSLLMISCSYHETTVVARPSGESGVRHALSAARQYSATASIQTRRLRKQMIDKGV